MKTPCLGLTFRLIPLSSVWSLFAKTGDWFRQRRSLSAVLLLVLATVCGWNWSRAGAQGTPVQVVSSASGEALALAPESLATAYGAQLATQSLSAAPGGGLNNNLGGTTVSVRDSLGAERPASLFYVSPGQVNFLLPGGTQAGPATITVRAGDGTTSTGTMTVSNVAPALFTANGNGAGVVAGYALRVKSDGSQLYESIAQFDGGQYKTKPINVSTPGDQVFLVFYLSGIRRATDTNGDGNVNEGVSVVVGGDSLTPVFAGAVPGAAGLEQINLALPGTLAGRGVVTLSVTSDGAPASNLTELEIAAANGTGTVTIANFNSDTVLAGQTLEINGTGFSTNPADNTVQFLSTNPPSVETVVTAATATRLTLNVPFGAGSGPVRVNVGAQNAVTSTRELAVRTSISGYLQDNVRNGIAGAQVRVRGTNIQATTNLEGAFVLPDVGPGLRILDVDPTTTGLPFPVVTIKKLVTDKRDNQLGFVEFRQTDGVVITPPAGDALKPAVTIAKLGEAAAPDDVAQSSIALELPPGSGVVCPPNDSQCVPRLTPYAFGRAPVDLPPGYFSSVIAQVSPFGTTFTQGGKLRFNNADNVPAGTAVRIFKLDQRPASATLGQFIDVGSGLVSSDGRTLETGVSTVNDGSYYFVSRQWPTATIFGHISDASGRPVRRAVVNARGQSTFTDGNGGFVLRNVPVIRSGDSVTVEVGFHRPDGSVLRATRGNVAITGGAQISLPGDIVLPPGTVATNATILAPETLTINEGETRTFNFVASGLAANAQPVLASAPAFATLQTLGGGVFGLRLSPSAGSAGSYQALLTALSASGATARHLLTIIVNRATAGTPFAVSQSVVTNEDTPVNVTLSSGNVSGTPIYTLTVPPLHGTLSGSLPAVTYTPAANFNGTDSFRFKVRSGTTESSEAVVSILILPVNDPPQLTVPGPQTISAGQTLKLLLSGADVDNGQTLSLTATATFPGATLIPLSATTWEYSWTPTFNYTGLQNITFLLRDDGTPQLSQTRSVTVVVNAKWARTSGPEGAIANAFVSTTAGLFAGTNEGVYFSANNGRSWQQVNTGLPDPVRVSSLVASGTTVYVGTDAGVFATGNSGKNWTGLNNGLSDTSVSTLAISGATLLAGTPSGIFRSTNSGQNWGPANSGLPSQRQTESLLISGSTVYAGVNGDVFRSGNLGSSWGNSGSGLPGLNVRALVVHNNQIHAATLGDGVYRLTTPTEGSPFWGRLPTAGLPTTEVVSLISSGTSLYAGLQAVLSIFEDGFGGGVYQLANNASGWTPRTTNLPANENVTALTIRSGTLFTGLQGSGVYASANGGSSWDSANSGITEFSTSTVGVLGANVFASGGGNSKDLFRSGDAGQSWTLVGTGFPRFAVVSRFANVGNTYFAATLNAGLYRSTDQGTTWTNITSALSALVVSDLAVIGNNLYATVAGKGVYISTNLGQSWSTLNSGLTTLSVGALAANGTTLFVGGQQGNVFRLSPGATSWVSVSAGLPAGFVLDLVANGNFLFALSGSTTGAIYRLPVGGSTWSPLTNGLPANFGAYQLAAVGTSVFAAAGSAGVYVSHNDGASWATLNDGLLAGVSVFRLAAGNNLLFAGTDLGIFVLSNNVQSWATLNTGLANRNVNSVLRNGSTLFSGTLGSGVFRSSDEGQTWSLASNGLTPNANVYALAAKGNGLFAAVFGDGVYRSDNNGQSWTAVNTGLSNRLLNALLVNGNSLFAATDGGVFRSDNDGGSWTLVSNGLTTVRTFSLFANGNTLFAGTDGGGVFASTNNGGNWTPVNNGLGNPYVLALTVSGNALYAGTDGGGVYRSLNNGQNWTALNNGLPPKLNVYSFAVLGSQLFAGSIYGVFAFNSQSNSWQQINAGLADVYVPALALGGNNLFAGTRVGGMFGSQLTAPCPLQIDQQPASRTIASNQSATLSVTASGATGLQYQWYRGVSGDVSQPVSGATGSSYQTPPLAQTANYWVRVTGGCGSLNSETASLIVNSVPQTDLSLTQSASASQVVPGTALAYTLTVANNGPSEAFALSVTDLLPPTVTFISCTATGGGVCSGTGNDRTVSFSSLAPGASAVITLAVTVNNTAGGGAITNLASVNALTSDVNLSNNTATAIVTVQANAPTLTSLLPSATPAGGPGFPLTVNGVNFAANSIVRWNNTDRATTFVSSTQLTATILASDILAPGSVSVTVATPGAGVSNALPFTIQPQVNRIVRVASVTGSVGGTVAVPVELVSQGDENALSFSLTFDPALLSNPQVALGTDAAGAQLAANTNQAAQGRLGVLVYFPAGQRFNAGTRRIVTVTFGIAANANPTSTNVGFGDAPLAREISDVSANSLPAIYSGGTVTITRGFESDVAPRPDGNGNVTVTDWVQIGRFVSGADAISPGGEFQRADAAPRDTFGNGALTVTDWVQAGRYAAGLDPLTPAAGPTAAATALQTTGCAGRTPCAPQSSAAVNAEPRTMRLSPVSFAEQRSSVTVELQANGDENAVSFSLRFDPRQWRFVSAELGADAASASLQLNARQTAQGALGVALALPPGTRWSTGLRSLVVVHFAAAEGGGALAPVQGFSDWPAAREIASAEAESLSAAWTPIATNELVNVSAAAFLPGALARDSIVAVFGQSLAGETQTAMQMPLPETLAGTSVVVTDRAGVTHYAPLFFVSPTQINYLLPAHAAEGLAQVRITNANGQTSTGLIQIADVAPSLFTVNADGQGLAAAVVLRQRRDGSRQIEPLAVFDPAVGQFKAAPIELRDDGEQVFVLLFGSGWRNLPDASVVKATADGIPVDVLFAGAQGEFAGLDQLNVRLPQSLRGHGETTLTVSVNGLAANAVKLVIR